MKEYDYIIAGTGAAGLQIAWCMSQDVYFQSKSILLIDQDAKNINDKTWCFWERGTGAWDEILEKSWKKVQFRCHPFDRTWELGDYTYKMLRSSRFYEFVFDRLSKCGNFYRVKGEVTSAKSIDNHVLVHCGDIAYQCRYLISSIADLNAAHGSTNQPWLLQHFKGWFIKTSTPAFNPEQVMLMDFNIPQFDNTRFMYVLPTDERSALVEYTLFSQNLLPQAEYDEAIKEYLSSLGIKSYEIIETETGVIPMTTHPFHRKNESRIIYVGTAGGWTKASTGYTFYLAGKRAAMLCMYLKNGKDLRDFHHSGRFVFYDQVVLDLLQRHNDRGAEFFRSIYSQQNINTIFDFLNEETTISKEINIIKTSSPRALLMKSVVNSILNRH